MQPTNNKIKAAVYCRVSTLDQVRDEVTIKGSLEEQEAQATKLAAERGWQLPPDCIYIEPGRSGEQFESRLALQKLLQDAKTGKFNILIVRAGDRLARDQEIYFRSTKILNQQYGVQIYNISNPTQIVEPEKFDARRNPGLIVQQGLDAMMAAFDQARRMALLDEGRRRQIKAGRVMCPTPPYGYKFEKTIKGSKIDTIAVPHPEEYEFLKLIRDWAIRDKLSEREIVTKLTELGAPVRGNHARKKEDAKWNKSSVARILTRAFYAGKVSYGIQATRLDENGKKVIRKAKDDSNITYGDHSFEHPWTWDEYLEIQRLRKTRGAGAQGPRIHTSPSPVAGLIKCGYCGYNMVFRPGTLRNQSKNRDKIRGDYFVCGAFNANHAVCQVNRVPARDILQMVFDWTTQLAEQEAADPKVFHAALKTSVVDAQLPLLLSQLETVKKNLESLPQKEKQADELYFNDGAITKEKYTALISGFAEKKKELREQQETLEQQLDTLKAKSGQADQIASVLQAWRGLSQVVDPKVSVRDWPEGLPRQLRSLFAGLYKTIAVKGEWITALEGSYSTIGSKGRTIKGAWRKRTIDIRFETID